MLTRTGSYKIYDVQSLLLTQESRIDESKSTENAFANIAHSRIQPSIGVDHREDMVDTTMEVEAMAEVLVLMVILLQEEAVEEDHIIKIFLILTNPVFSAKYVVRMATLPLNAGIGMIHLTL